MIVLRRLVFVTLALMLTAARPVAAQEAVFIQIEAQPSLARAEQRVRDYASFLQNVNGFSLGGGWYGVALGPYDRDAAQALLVRLRGQGQIPRDSYLAEPGDYSRQFWPVGAALNLAPRPAPLAPDTAQPDAEPEPLAEAPQTEAPQTPAEPEFKPVDETPREARASESRLTRDERRVLQEMLQWAGFYESTIDGLFGRGTRTSMAAWQQANGYEPTGIMTTAQRAALLGQYNAVLDGMGLREIEDTIAGVRMEIPTGVVAFEKYDSPFAHYTATGDLDATVLLISQPGDQTTLYGLYEIMQTLAIVPLDGPRERRRQSFTLEGRNDLIVSYTEAGLVGGAVKGFTLIWPAGDEERRTRVLDRMRESFRATDAVLDPSRIDDDAQDVDLLAGLEIRQPKLTRSGFFVDRSGSVLTTLEAVESCTRITIDGDFEAAVAASDPASGVALLKPATALAPMQVAAFRDDSPRLKSEVAVAGYSYGGALTAPTITYGSLADLNGLDGEEQVKRLALAALPGDAGGPVLDTGGAVLGMLLPREDGARQLPEDVSFAIKADVLRALARQAGIDVAATSGETAMAPEDLSTFASEMTVLVSCWD